MKTLYKFLLATLVMLSVGVCYAQDEGESPAPEAQYSITKTEAATFVTATVDVAVKACDIAITYLNQTSFSVKEQCTNDAPLLIDYGCSNSTYTSEDANRINLSHRAENYPVKLHRCNSDFKVGWQS